MPSRTRAVLLVVLTALGLLSLPVLGASASPTVALSVARGQAGTETTVTAAGFPRSAPATVVLSGATTRLRTDRAGRLGRALIVPASATGAVTVTVATSRVRASAVFTLTKAAPAPEPAVRTPLRFGVTTPGGPQAAGELDHVAAVAGEAPSVLLFYRGFGSEPDVTELDAVAARGATPLVTWEPYDWRSGVDQPQYALARLRDGSFDPYLRRWADALRSWRRPVLLRFAHEMNGDWYPWCEGVNGNRPGDYVATWRHIHQVFQAAGATNVQWVWSPNATYTGSTGLARLYPGAGYVDWVALDGYNWGSSRPGHRWQSPGQVFDATLAEVAALAPGKPVMIAETASTEVGGDKAAWVGQLFDWLARQRQLSAFVWFDHDKETDWRIDSSSAASTAFEAGLSRLRVGGRSPSAP